MTTENRKRIGTVLTTTLILSAFAGLLAGLCWLTAAQAATPITGAISAKASGGVTAKTFVKLSSAGVVSASTARTDKVVGVCEQTALTTKATKYAPVGTQAVVTAAETVAVGDIVTSGASGYAYVFRPGVLPQRAAGVALTAATVGTDLTIIVWPSVTGSTDQTLTAIAVDTTLAANDSGLVYNVTADSVITLPPTAAGITYTFVNGSTLDAGVLIQLDPNGVDKISGVGTTGTDDHDYANTKLTAKRGDMVRIVGNGTDGWLIQRIVGIWAWL